jgi:hypothetical protein
MIFKIIHTTDEKLSNITNINVLSTMPVYNSFHVCFCILMRLANLHLLNANNKLYVLQPQNNYTIITRIIMQQIWKKDTDKYTERCFLWVTLLASKLFSSLQKCLGYRHYW